MIPTLQELARQVRHATLRLVEETDPGWLLWTPSGTSNHLLWHAGHALWVQDALTTVTLTGASLLPDGWSESFGMDCRPVSETVEWPGPEEVARRLREQLDELCGQMETHATQLAGDAKLLGAVVHGWHDEARHQGEMLLLCKLRRHANQSAG